MTQEISAIPPRSFVVTLGDLTFYATQWAIAAAREYRETGGATGTCFLTNSCQKARKITLSGWLHFESDPAERVVTLETMMQNQTRFAFTLRGMRIISAVLTSYEISEKSGEGLLPCTLTLVTTTAFTLAT